MSHLPPGIPLVELAGKVPCVKLSAQGKTGSEFQNLALRVQVPQYWGVRYPKKPCYLGTWTLSFFGRWMLYDDGNSAGFINPTAGFLKEFLLGYCPPPVTVG